MDEKNRFLNTYKKKMAEQGDIAYQNSATEEQEGFKPEEENIFAGSVKKSTGSMRIDPKKKRIIAAIVAGFVLLVGIVAGVMLFMNQGVEVIDLTGWTENDAQLWARDNGVILQIEEEYNDEFETGKVVSQSIAKGTKVKKGEFIKLVVSLGHDLTVKLPLPDIMSMTKEEIEAWAAENFMTKVRITAEYSDEIPLGRVIRYEINDDTVVDEVSRNTPIYIIVSKGPEDEAALSITVPNFKEMAISECYAFANENGLVLTVEEQYDDYVPVGSIISQSVKADEKVAKGTEIILTISKGKMVIVPSFSGYTKEKAAAVAGELGIPIVIKEKYSSAAAGVFISQSIKAGSEYKDGDILELSYSLGNSIVISSFVGQMRDAIESWAKDLNEKGANITIKVKNTQSNSPKGTILYQDKANTVIGVKATINITVSKGKVVYVPDFVAPAGSGYDVAITREKALAMCEEVNIVPIFEEAPKSGRLPGEIWYQSIAAGTEITEGSTIILKYVPADAKVTVPNFVKMTKEEVLAGDYSKMFNIIFVEGTEYVEGYANKVYEQSPRANAKVAAGSVVTLTIGPEGTPKSEP